MLLLAACGPKSNGSEEPDPAHIDTSSDEREYEATIRWTSHGVPHIVADDLGSLTFGQGYAYARGHICVLADQIVEVRSERSRYFGRGPKDDHVDSDFGYLALDIMGRAEQMVATASEETRAVLEGFAAGYNHYLAEVGPAGLPAPCRDAPWVKPIDAVDLAAHGLDVSWLASSGAWVQRIGRAYPHAGEAPPAGEASPPPASNAWAIGAEKSATGRGMLVANPHFPWEGALTFYESHLTLRGDFDAYGATIQGAPLLSIAFNEHLAWTHTFSASSQFAVYRVRLDPDDPTRYRYDGDTRTMTGEVHIIDVKQADGSLAEERRKLYHTHYGPMIDGGPLSWDTEAGFGFTLVDAAADTSKAIDQYLAMLRATDLTSFQDAMAEHQSTPFVNTIYADRDGNAFYVDGSRVPDLTQAGLTGWRLAMRSVDAVRKAWQEQGVIAADGSLSVFALSNRNEVAPGAVPYADAPKLVRRDFVFNANDSYWATNPAEPLDGASPFYGDVHVPLSPRSRINLTMLTEKRPGGASGEDGVFTRGELAAAMLSNRTLAAEILRDDVVAACRRIAGSRVPKRACATLAGWNGTVDLDARGAVLWRELLTHLPLDAYFGDGEDGALWAEEFDRYRPIETPRGLSKKADPVIAEALAAAIAALEKAGADPFTATLGDVQHTMKGERRIPVHGGGSAEGTTNFCRYTGRVMTLYPPIEQGEVIHAPSGLTSRGYPINYGTSFLMIVELTDGAPVAEGLMTYGASSDPASPHFADQTEMWSDKQLRPLLFTDAQIQADPNLRVQTIRNR